ncbi:hypothetical protein M378DRAFT_71534 [Amanita muscaria Koide BX008]|uniref:Uncharacterized protein n=1 Tax=Amanita muscaria (strain Koide BX008) TaxID=946122 RepID=A0A0C2TMK2_AMAMK|nr:hypothetical protein M378DRAFT_71534 [Amanita muscaria Koide BX008]
MCYREVKCVKHSCGHEAPIEDRRVDCGSNRCRYSSSHAASCTDCSSTCNQWYVDKVRFMVSMTGCVKVTTRTNAGGAHGYAVLLPLSHLVNGLTSYARFILFLLIPIFLS